MTKSRLTIGMDGDNFEFLIVGAGRGGTSLLAVLLDSHPDLEVGMELHSTACLVGKELPYRGADLLHQRVTAFVSGCVATANGYPRWGNKITTEQIYALEDHNLANPHSKVDILDQFFNKYLKGRKVVFILRDGRTCVNSKVRRAGLSFEVACDFWRYSVRCFQFLRTRHSNNICVRFEDLLTQPRTVLTRVCDFLEIEYLDEMLNGLRNAKMLPEYRSEKFDLTKTDSIELPDDSLRAIKDDLEYCGYA